MAQRYEEREYRKEQEASFLKGPNKLEYVTPAMAGLISSRTNMTFPFNNLTSTWGQTVNLTTNTGEQYLYGPACFLRLEWTIPANVAGGAGTISFGYGSIMNVVNQVILNHSSGQQLEQVQYVNQLANTKMRYNTSTEDAKKLSALLGGYDVVADGAVASAFAGGFDIGTTIPGAVNQQIVTTQPLVRISNAVGAPAQTYVSMIPLSYYLGVFDRRDQMIPAALLAGSTMYVQFEQITNAITTTGTGTTLAPGIIFKPSIVYDTSKLFDSVHGSILEQSASVGGVPFMYSTYFISQQQVNGTAVSYDIQFPASITQNAYASLVVPAATPNGASNFTNASVVTQFQWRIAADYKPQQPVVNTSTAGNFTEAYMYALATWQSGVHLYDYVDTPVGGSCVSLQDFETFASIYGTTLERSPAGLQLTGVPTNNANLINFTATKSNANHTVYVFLQYLRVANIRDRNIVVDR